MIQVVFVKWGVKYTAESVNRLLRAVRANTRTPVRFVLVTDQVDPEIDPEIVIKAFPTFALPFDEVVRGCRAKLSIFAEGILDPDLPTVYLDLDTVVRGDISRLTDNLAKNPGLHMLQNHLVQFWRVRPLLRAIGFRKYYFGNSSILVFLPRRFHFIFEEFNRITTGTAPPWPRHLRTDERFVSWCARDHVRVISRRLATKFAEEFMAPVIGLEAFRRQLPWVVRRRRGLVAITFVGPNMKPSALASLERGAILRRHRLKYRWDPDEFRDYWVQ
jgi:hypothetical protein